MTKQNKTLINTKITALCSPTLYYMKLFRFQFLALAGEKLKQI